MVAVPICSLSNETSHVHTYTFYKHTITHNSDDSAYLITVWILFACSYRFRHLRQAHQSHLCNEACVFAFATVCLFATGNSNVLITDHVLPRNLPFLWLPSERSIDGLDFHQLIYVRIMAYQRSLRKRNSKRIKHKKIVLPFVFIACPM